MSATVTGPRWQVLRGDALDLLAGLPDHSVDAVVTDPPYGIGFRGETWDTIRTADVSPGEAFEQWVARWAVECLRVLKPGGHLVAFGAPRMAHRLGCGLEDAGFELRDQLAWLYGTGVPKARLHNGRSSALKPGYEPILLARAPLEGTLERTEQTWGTGRLGIDAARGKDGRWPCNVALSHATTCTTSSCVRRCPIGQLDARDTAGRLSRFFYCAKPSRGERDAGCIGLPARRTTIYGARLPRPRRNTHPTVKPVELMRWLVRLTCPSGGVVLDPFAGSASTGIAALSEGRRFIGIERDPEYARIARARLRHAARAGDGRSG